METFLVREFAQFSMGVSNKLQSTRKFKTTRVGSRARCRYFLLSFLEFQLLKPPNGIVPREKLLSSVMELACSTIPHSPCQTSRAYEFRLMMVEDSILGAPNQWLSGHRYSFPPPVALVYESGLPGPQFAGPISHSSRVQVRESVCTLFARGSQ
jgi:hypothetical protein